MICWEEGGRECACARSCRHRDHRSWSNPEQQPIAAQREAEEQQRSHRLALSVSSVCVCVCVCVRGGPEVSDVRDDGAFAAVVGHLDFFTLSWQRGDGCCGYGRRFLLPGVGPGRWAFGPADLCRYSAQFDAVLRHPLLEDAAAQSARSRLDGRGDPAGRQLGAAAQRTLSRRYSALPLLPLQVLYSHQHIITLLITVFFLI